MKSFYGIAAAVFVLVVSTASIADQPPTLPTIPVVGHPCAYVYACVYISPMSQSLVWTAPPDPYPPLVDSIPVDGVDDAPLVATCQSLRDRANQMGCDVNNPPPAPSFPSPTRGQWQSNGCGAGGLSNSVAEYILDHIEDGFTGNLDEPLSGFSFKDACVGHDSCYHVSGSKTLCDNAFRMTLIYGVCAGNFRCQSFADDYYVGVSLAGGGAYAADQRDMECAKIASDLKDGNCVS